MVERLSAVQSKELIRTRKFTNIPHW